MALAPPAPPGKRPSELDPAVLPLAEDDIFTVSQDTTGAAPLQPKSRRLAWAALRNSLYTHLDARIDAGLDGTATYSDVRAEAARIAAVAYTDSSLAQVAAGFAPKASPAFVGDASFSADVTVGGDLIVQGTTVTTTSTSLTVADPILTLGGDAPPTADDGKDRGVEFRWHDGAGPQLGFFGFDRSTGRLAYRPQAVNAGDVFAGAIGTIEANLLGDVAGNVSGTASNVTGTVAIGNGGTGAATPAAARAALGAAPLDSPALTGSPTANGGALWTAANDGPGSGLDADLLDGHHGAHYRDLGNATGDLAVSRLASGVNAGPGTYWRGDGQWASPAASTLDGLVDVAITAPAAGHVLRSDGMGLFSNGPLAVALSEIAATGTRDGTTVLHGNGTWAAPAGGGGGASSLDGLSDVTLTAPTQGQVLRRDGNGQFANAALGVADVSGAAPLASPALTGNPTAPTPAAGDNDTSIATTAFVAGATAGRQAADPGLASLAALAGAGVVIATATDAFAMRPIGVAAATDIPDRQAADARYAGLAGAAFTGRVRVAVASLTDAASIATNAAAADIFTVTIAGNRTLANPTSPAPGDAKQWRIKQDAAGNRSMAYGTAFKFPGGAAPVLSTAPNAVDILSCVCIDGTAWECGALVKDVR